MNKNEASHLFEKLEKERSSKVIVYFTSDRKPPQLFATKIALDVVELFYQHLKKIGQCKKISLCICSNGGNLDTPWPLVNLIREYCKELEILVPYKALSAATLISLGGNKIVMPPMGQLSPIDPEGHYNVEGKDVNLSVEDIFGFVDLAKQKIGITEQLALSEVLKSLVSEVKPSILGSVYRTHSLIRRLAKNLLRLHLKTSKDEKKINDIVEHLTQKLFSHQHFINRQEAKHVIGFGNIIEFASSSTEGILNEVLDHYYYKELEMNNIFNPLKMLADKDKKTYKAKRAFIESLGIKHVFESQLTLTKIKGALQPNVNVDWQSWNKYELGGGN